MQKMQHEEKFYRLKNIHLIKVEINGRYHTLFGNRIYDSEFKNVGKYYSLGVATAEDHTGAYHIDLEGMAIYKNRFEKTYGFYCNRAAVKDEDFYYHINLDGSRCYQENYDWVGNYQEFICVVRKNNKFFHIDQQGIKLYDEEYDYVGDFYGGFAVVRKNGLCTHIDVNGNFLHNKWYNYLTLFHKGYAIAESSGYFHININGDEIYPSRYKFLEPFYNDLAYAESFEGKKGQINYSGNFEHVIELASIEQKLNNISSELVGFWTVYLLNAAIEIDLFTILPCELKQISHIVGISENNLKRFLMALFDLGFATFDDNLWKLSDKGLALKEMTFLQDAAVMWSRVASQKNWLKIIDLLKLEDLKSFPIFKMTEKNEDLKIKFFKALIGYAANDLKNFNSLVNIYDKKEVIIFGISSLAFCSILKNSNIVYFTEDEFCAKFAENHYGVKSDNKITKNYDLAIFCRHLHHENNPEDYLKLCQDNGVKDVLIVETLIDDNKAFCRMLDINILVESGGKLRTLEEWEEILKKFSSNFQVLKIQDWLFVINVKLK